MKGKTTAPVGHGGKRERTLLNRQGGSLKHFQRLGRCRTSPKTGKEGKLVSTREKKEGDGLKQRREGGN